MTFVYILTTLRKKWACQMWWEEWDSVGTVSDSVNDERECGEDGIKVCWQQGLWTSYQLFWFEKSIKYSKPWSFFSHYPYRYRIRQFFQILNFFPICLFFTLHRYFFTSRLSANPLHVILISSYAVLFLFWLQGICGMWLRLTQYLQGEVTLVLLFLQK